MDETLEFDISNDPATSQNLGDGDDRVVVTADPGVTEVRLTFTSAEVGDGSAIDSGSMTNQDGGLAVRVRAEDAEGGVIDPASRFDDEGIRFVSGTDGLTFDVRDLVSGTQRGNLFSIVQLGTVGSDAYILAGEMTNIYANAGMGDDVIITGSGNDFLVGGGGDDRLIGNAGNDSFIGGLGNDMIMAGAGDDSFTANLATDGRDRVSMGRGNDTITVSSTGATQIRLTFTSAEVGNNVQQDAGTAANQDGGLAVRARAEDGDGNVTGSFLRGEDEGVTYVAGGGATFDVRDLVSGIARGDQFTRVTLGNMYDDTYDFSALTENIYVNGGMGDDVLTGGSGNDFLVGGLGNDTFTTGLGMDNVLGGAGDDTLYINVNVDGPDRIDLGAGRDTVYVTSDGAPQVRMTIVSSEVGNGSGMYPSPIPGEAPRLPVILQTEGLIDFPFGTDSRYDDEGTLFIIEDSTFDIRDISGTQRGDQFTMAYLGEVGDEMLDFSAETANMYINAGLGDDRIMAGSGNDFLVGGGGNDRLNGGTGNNSFLGGLGNDVIGGGSGDDIAYLNIRTDGADRINLSSGNDTISVSGTGLTQVRLTFTSAEVGNNRVFDSGALANQDGDFAVRVQGENDQGNVSGAVTRTEDEGVTFVATGGVTFDVRDLVSGTERGDVFTRVSLGTSTNNVMNFADLTDRIYANAGEGNDVLRGGQGGDFLVGGMGDDRLDGRAGSDSLLGGMGADTFVFTGARALDTILDFVSGTDKIDLSRLDITADDVTASQVGSNTRLSVDMDGDDMEDFGILLIGVGAPVASDYIL